MFLNAFIATYDKCPRQRTSDISIKVKESSSCQMSVNTESIRGTILFIKLGSL